MGNEVSFILQTIKLFMSSELLLLLALAVAPSLAFGVFIYWRDKFDKEPIHLLIACFFLGAIACIPAAFMENLLDQKIMPLQYGLGGLFLSAFVLIALVEEGWKFIFTLLMAYRRKAFNEPYDGITYAVMVSLGFATLENIVYVLDGGIQVAIIRMFTAVPAHVTFGIIMGYFLGWAKFSKNSIWYKLTGLLVAVLFHGAYDFSLFSTERLPLMIGGAVLSLLIGIILSFRAIHLHRKNSPFNPNGDKYNGKKG